MDTLQKKIGPDESSSEIAEQGLSSRSPAGTYVQMELCLPERTASRPARQSRRSENNSPVLDDVAAAREAAKILEIAVHKAGLAKYYHVGVRTIENWIAKRLITGTAVGRSLIFNVVECDARFISFTRQSGPRTTTLTVDVHRQTGRAVSASIIDTERPRTYATVEELASRYKVTTKTIKNWKRGGLLPFLKVSRVVRFDVEACDQSLRRYGY